MQYSLTLKFSFSIKFAHFRLNPFQISPEISWKCRQTVFMSHHLHFLLKLPLPRETLGWGPLPLNIVESKNVTKISFFFKDYLLKSALWKCFSFSERFRFSFINSGPVHFSGSLDYKGWGKFAWVVDNTINYSTQIHLIKTTLIKQHNRNFIVLE